MEGRETLPENKKARHRGVRLAAVVSPVRVKRESLPCTHWALREGRERGRGRGEGEGERNRSLS